MGGMLIPWDPERDETLVCVAVRDETHDVRTFVFAASEPRRFDFRPGQFLTFSFEVEGRTIPRCYTIASPPTRPDRLAISVKRQPGGAVSPWLHATLRPGARVAVAGPMGDFCAAAEAPGKRLFLSGGSGVTPLMSMTRAAYDLGAASDLVFVHAARTPDDIVFRAELAAMARHWPGLRTAFVCEADSPGESWGGFRGRLSLPMLRLIAPDLLEREVFCCGPAPFMAAVRAMLDEAGFDRAAYHEESFDFAGLPAAERAEATRAETEIAAGFMVEFTKSGRTIRCPPGSTVLDAARAEGLRLPSSCAKGMCGTCKSRMLSGKVEMNHAGGIRQREIDAGLVLLCCSRPLADLVVER
jgi:ferredoxin-NADP reductase